MGIGFGNRKGDGWGGGDDDHDSHSWGARHGRSEDWGSSPQAEADRLKSEYQRGLHDGAEAERKRVVAWLESLDELTIHDWGLNATGNIIEAIEAGDHALEGGGGDG